MIKSVFSSGLAVCDYMHYWEDPKVAPVENKVKEHFVLTLSPLNLIISRTSHSYRDIVQLIIFCFFFPFFTAGKVRMNGERMK